jgi:asparagine synthetase B (glutamine-hydrolysing)
MCRICGIFSHAADAPAADRDELLEIRESMRSRGSDGDGLWVASHGCVGLAHRRLAILEVRTGL